MPPTILLHNWTKTLCSLGFYSYLALSNSFIFSFRLYLFSMHLNYIGIKALDFISGPWRCYKHVSKLLHWLGSLVGMFLCFCDSPSFTCTASCSHRRQSDLPFWYCTIGFHRDLEGRTRPTCCLWDCAQPQRLERMLPQLFSSLNGSWERIFSDSKRQHRKTRILGLSGLRINWAEPHVTQLCLSSALPGWATFPRCTARSNCRLLQAKYVLLRQKTCQRGFGLSEWILTLKNWFRKWDLLNAKKNLVAISSLIKIKNTLRREAHNCKSFGSIKTGNAGWRMPWLFYAGNGSEVVVNISNICHALQLLSCQCTQHIINKWVTGKQLEI